MHRGSMGALATLATIALFAAVGAAWARGQDLPELERQNTAAMEAGHYRVAEQIARRGLAISASILNEESIAVWCNRLGMALWRLNRFDEAEEVYKRAIAIFERLHGPEHHNVAACLSNLAVLYMRQGRYAEAEPFYERERSIELRELGPDHPEYATSLNNLGILYRNQGRYTEAEPLYRQAVAILERVLGLAHPVLARSLHNLANLYSDQGRYAEAEPFYNRALIIRERALGPEHQDVAQSLRMLARMYEIQGRYGEARPLLVRALAILEKANGPEDLDVGFCLEDLANMYVDQDIPDQAGPLARRAIEIIEKALGHDADPLAPCLHNLAYVGFRDGRYAEAVPLLDRALAIREKRHDPFTASHLYLLARVEVAQGHAEKAEDLVSQAIAASERYGSSSGFRASLYYFRASIRWKAGRRDDALNDLRTAMRLADDQRGMISGGEVERAASFADYAGAYERMVQWQVQLGGVAEALDAVERSRARSLLDEMTMAGVDLQAGRPPVERQRIERDGAALHERVARLEKQLSSASADPARKAEAERIGGELTEARRRLYEYARDLRTSSPLYRQLLNRGAGPPSLDRIQEKICGDGGLLLVYLFGRDGGYVLAIGRDRARLVPLALDGPDAGDLGVVPGPLTADRLQAILIGSRGSGVVPRLAEPGSRSPAPVLAVLWRVLVPEAERQALVDGTIKRLIVVPDGPLAFLPFEALVVEGKEEPRYLLDVGPPIVYAPSATILMGLAGRAEIPAIRDRDPVLAVGDPVYPRANPGAGSDVARRPGGTGQRYSVAGGALARLPFSGLEAHWVARVFNDAGVRAGLFTGVNATEAGVRYWAPGRRVLHLACHGLTEQSLGNFFGALAVTPGPNADSDPSDDGFLTLPEVYGLDLKGCELAILSACQTNFGPQQRGEGTWSLSRGFLVAGARRLVASDWLVDDEAAANLVSAFCSGIAADEKAGKAVDYAGALQRARRWVRGQEKWKAPYYWASLVLVGPG